MVKKLKCKCAPGTPFRTVKERDGQAADVRKYYPWDKDGPNPTRTGHQLGCPCDVGSYKHGEWYANCSPDWFAMILGPKSGDMLEAGEPNMDNEDQRNAKKLVGVYRKKKLKK